MPPPSPRRSSSGLSAFLRLRRFSTPASYTDENILVEEPAADPAFIPMEQRHDQDPSLHPSSPVGTVHQYNLKSGASITIMSHARKVQDPPLLYIGEELEGSVSMSLNDLSSMLSVHVVFQMFDCDPIVPSFETKRILLAQQIDRSYISNGVFRFPFTMAPPTTLVPSSNSSSSSAVESPLGYRPTIGNSTGSNPRFQLVVTIYRQGRLTSNVRVNQVISYIPPPDPSVLQSSPPSTTISLPYEAPANLPWKEQKLPSVVVMGIMFRRVHVEVECKLIIPISYPASGIIPLRLVLTSENHEALDLVTAPHVINVELVRVMDYGDNAGTVRPLKLMDRKSFQDSHVVAKAHWELDGYPKELSPNERHERTRWRIKLKGEFQREPGVVLDPSFEMRGMVIMYIARLFPFCSKDFRPTSKSKRELVMGKIELTDPALAADVPPASA